MISRLATTRAETQGAALLLVIDKREIKIEHTDLSRLSSATQIQLELDRQAGKALDGVFVHVNRDGSLALAVGREPAVWPEDWPVDKDV